MNVPAVAKTCATVTPLPVAPSPKFQLYEVIGWPGAATDGPALNETVWPTCGAELVMALANQKTDEIGRSSQLDSYKASLNVTR